MSRTGAEFAIDTLIDAGVRYLFSVSGNQILPLYDATIGRNIEIIHTRHEAAAVHMADGWGRLTEQPGVALVTAGPGHCNALSALYTAQMAESPVVLLSGHSPLTQLGRGAFQEMDQVASAQPLTKAGWLVQDAANLSVDLARALRLSRSGRPGPVHLSLPQDILSDVGSNPSGISAKVEARPPPDEGTIERIVNLLQEAERPLILCGPAMSRSARWSKVERLSSVTGIPALPMESPRGINDPWLHAATNCLSRADTVILLGKKLDFTLGFSTSVVFANDCRVIQIDADKGELRRHPSVALACHADPEAAARLLAEAAGKMQWSSGSWREDVETSRTRLPKAWEGLSQGSATPIHPLRLCKSLANFLDDDAVLVCDGGEIGQWMQAGLEAPCRLINGPSGAIGSSVPLGLAAKLKYPNKNVFVLCGDGTFGYHASELDTGLRYDLPIVVIVGNDARWNAEHQLQLQHYGEDRLVGCELLPTRYDKVAAALGGHGEFVEHSDEIVPAVERALAAKVPACVNVLVEPVGAPTFRG